MVAPPAARPVLPEPRALFWLFAEEDETDKWEMSLEAEPETSCCAAEEGCGVA